VVFPKKRRLPGASKVSITRPFGKIRERDGHFGASAQAGHLLFFLPNMAESRSVRIFSSSSMVC